MQNRGGITPPLLLPRGGLQILLVEALIAFTLVFIVISMTTETRVSAGTAAVAIGFALAAGVLLGGLVSGGAGNLARARADDRGGDVPAVSTRTGDRRR